MEFWLECFAKVRVATYATCKFIRDKEESCKKRYCLYWSHTLVIGIMFTKTIIITAFIQRSTTQEENTSLWYHTRKPWLAKDSNKKRSSKVYVKGKWRTVLIAWKEKRLVRMIISIHDASLKSSGKRKRNSGNEDTVKSICILQYNKYMKGVDHADQYF